MRDAELRMQKLRKDGKYAWLMFVVWLIAGFGFPPLWVFALGYLIMANVKGVQLERVEAEYLAAEATMKHFKPIRGPRLMEQGETETF